ncbi:MAG TPA: hypothetical protein VMS38_34945 [Pseudorhodoferax sp.]|nr:hypothetical protein [Pseudorhodoferax sp.]
MPGRLLTAGLALAMAGTLALLSVHIERLGPEQASYGNLCGPSANKECLQAALGGGFPFAFLLDMPGISVQGQLHFIEDRFSPVAFLFDVVFYLAVLLALSRLKRLVRRSG